MMHLFRSPKSRIALLAACAGVTGFTSAASAQRAIGIDVSSWQGVINWTSVASSGKQFAFIRSSRGGTTGTFNPSTNTGTLSHRYDDPLFVSNINNATSNGLVAGPYHYARADISTNTGLDEANHFIEQAGAYMKPGYLRPVLDLEAGSGRTAAELTAWALEFANRIYDQKGVMPLCYVNSSYANDEIQSGVTVMPLWIARYPTGAHNVQTQDPSDHAAASYPNVYGKWNPTYPTIPTPEPWAFWQHSITGSVPGISGNVDLDVANGDINYVREFKCAAAWVSNANANWTDATRWNTSPALPGSNDRVVIDRPAGVYTITLASGAHSIKSLSATERLILSGGSLAVTEYLTSTTQILAQGATVTAGSMQYNNLLTQSAGSITVNGPLTGTGSINISGGEFAGQTIQQNNINVNNSGKLRLLGTGVAATVSVIKTFAATGTAAMDIGDEAVVIDWTTTNPYNTIRGYIASGMNGGDWNGIGINSATAANHPERLTAIAIATPAELDNATEFLGQPVDASSVLIRYTWYGDADLNGMIDFDDYTRIDSGFNASLSGWVNGDFSYDGVIDFDDYVLIDSAFNGQTGTLIDAINWLTGDNRSVSAGPGVDRVITHFNQFGLDYANAFISAVPEPGAMSLAGLAIVASARRRRAN